MSDMLAQITAYKREEVARAKRAVSFQAMEMRAFAEPRPRDFMGAIRARHAAGGPALIAEIKRASPSKGVIRADFDVGALAAAYEAGGATCLSVLTDQPSFDGRPEYIKVARAASGLPVLRKDFLVDSYQVFEARSLGADAILVILAMVDDDGAQALIGTAEAIFMTALVEVSTEAELARALALDADLIGINNRDLRTFETNLATSERLAATIPSDRVVVAESGIAAPADIARLRAAGIETFLVGESLMRQQDVAEATRRLLATEAASAA